MSHHVKTVFVKTRKVHGCWGCCADIPAGHEVERTTCVDMGQIFSLYTCDICREVISHWDDQDREWMEQGSAKEGCPEDWEDARKLLEDA